MDKYFLGNIPTNLTEDEQNAFIKGLFSLITDYESCINMIKIISTNNDEINIALLKELIQSFLKMLINIQYFDQFQTTINTMKNLMKKYKLTFNISDMQYPMHSD